MRAFRRRGFGPKRFCGFGLLSGSKNGQNAVRLAEGENIVGQWRIWGLQVYATEGRVFFYWPRRRQVLEAKYSEIDVKPHRRRLPQFLILGFLLLYLGLFTSFPPITAILGVVCLVAFVFMREKEFVISIPASNKPIVVRQTPLSREMVNHIAESAAKGKASPV